MGPLTVDTDRSFQFFSRRKGTNSVGALFAESWLITFLVASGLDTFTECDIRLLNFAGVHFDNALPLYAWLQASVYV